MQIFILAFLQICWLILSFSNFLITPGNRNLDMIWYGTAVPPCSKLVNFLLDTQYMQFTVNLAKLLQNIK